MRQERGAAGLVVLAIAITAMFLGLLVIDVSSYLHARSRAQLAADSAALAAAPVTFRSFGGTGSPAAEAAAFAAANGARLLECRCPEDPSWGERTVVVEVAVTVDTILLPVTAVHATSRAEFVPTSLSG